MTGILPDPNKRSFLLPPGCKDLHDVLQRQHRGRASAARRSFTIDRDDATADRLSALGRYVAQIAGSAALTRSLFVQTLDQQFSMIVAQGKRSPMRASLCFEIGTKQDEAMREFCVRHSFPVPEDTGAPTGVVTGSAASQIYNLSPLPTEASQATTLLLSLMREVVDLDEQSQASFRYQEVRRTE